MTISFEKKFPFTTCKSLLGSNIETKEVPEKLGLIFEKYMTVGKLRMKDEVFNFHPKKSTLWIIFINQKFFVS